MVLFKNENKHILCLRENTCVLIHIFVTQYQEIVRVLLSQSKEKPKH